MSNHLKQLGGFGERLAARYLTSQGYQIIVSNFHLRNGQIDLICQTYPGQLSFIEVKTRFHDFLGHWQTSSEFKIAWQQRIALLRTAKKFLAKYDQPVITWQFDLIWINLERQKNQKLLAKIKHLKNIFAE